LKCCHNVKIFSQGPLKYTSDFLGWNWPKMEPYTNYCCKMRVNERKEQKMLAKKWKENNVIDFRRFLWVVTSLRMVYYVRTYYQADKRGGRNLISVLSHFFLSFCLFDNMYYYFSWRKDFRSLDCYGHLADKKDFFVSQLLDIMLKLGENVQIHNLLIKL